MTREDKLKIARAAFKEILAAMKIVELAYGVTVHWQEYITVDHEEFRSHELMEDDE